MANLCLSSETYKIDVKDIAALEDSRLNTRYKKSKTVIILMGDSDHGVRDTLLCGRALVERALSDGQKYIDVKIA